MGDLWEEGRCWLCVAGEGQSWPDTAPHRPDSYVNATVKVFMSGWTIASNSTVLHGHQSPTPDHGCGPLLRARRQVTSSSYSGGCMISCYKLSFDTDCLSLCQHRTWTCGFCQPSHVTSNKPFPVGSSRQWRGAGSRVDPSGRRQSIAQ